MNRVLLVLLLLAGIGGYLHFSNKASDKPAGPMALNNAGNVLVEMYATSWCGYCKKMREDFAKNKIQYVEYDIEADAEAAKRHADLGGVGVPLTHVGRQVVVDGYAPEEVLAAMQKR